VEDDTLQNTDAPIKYLTLSEVASILKISRPTLLRIINDGQIPAFKVAGQWRIAESRLEEALESSSSLRLCVRLDDRREILH
jgi:excisionase family DNA binding protein